MEEKRPVDEKRDRGFSTEIGSAEDGAINDMINFEGKIIVVKEKALYELMVADYVDPNRENPDLSPDIQKKILNRGSDSEMVCRTFIMTNMLLKAGHLPKTLNASHILKLMFEALVELVEMDSEVESYLTEEKKESIEYEERKAKGAPFAIPAIGNVETRCKTIFQKADHITQILMEIITVFYPTSGLAKQAHFNSFLEFLKKTYGEDDVFAKFIEDGIEFLELMRALRNCLDHRLTNVIVKDFDLQVSSDIISPTIELVNYRGSKLHRVSLSSYLPEVVNIMVFFIENLIGYLCDKNARKDWMDATVRYIPEEERRYKFVQYCFWSPSPIGLTGFFHQ